MKTNCLIVGQLEYTTLDQVPRAEVCDRPDWQIETRQVAMGLKIGGLSAGLARTFYLPVFT